MIRTPELFVFGATVAVSLSVASAATADDAKALSYGRHLSQECSSCHRIDGIDNGIPSIVAWDRDTFITTMKFYQAGARPNPAMVSVAQSLDDAQINALATYYASLPKPERRPDAAKAAAPPRSTAPKQ